MQIKKGPYGYYAIEKFDSPDRLCSYAEEVIAGNKTDFYLRPVTEIFGSGAMCCFEFSGYMQITDPEFSVFSPNKKTASKKKDAKNLNLRRKSCGDLFYAVAKLLDNLISPSCLVLDPNMMFTDPDGITVKMCCLPIKSDPNDLCISSLGASRLEELLNCDFFKSVITDDERNALVYSVKENKEDLFLKVARIIKGIDEEPNPALPEQDTDSKVQITGAIKNLSRPDRDLIIAGLSAFLSLASILNRMLLPCFLFYFLAIIIFATTLLNMRRNKESIEKEESEEVSKQRSSILFSDLPQTSDSEENLFIPLTSGKLTLISDRNDVKKNYSVYLSETTIGSDCFLSDIVIDDPLIAPLHAVIKQKDGAFYLEPSKGTGRTYIEDSPLENGRSYESKSGQKISFGEIEFRFSS